MAAIFFAQSARSLFVRNLYPRDANLCICFHLDLVSINWFYIVLLYVEIFWCVCVYVRASPTSGVDEDVSLMREVLFLVLCPGDMRKDLMSSLKCRASLGISPFLVKRPARIRTTPMCHFNNQQVLCLACFGGSSVNFAFTSSSVLCVNILSG